MDQKHSTANMLFATFVLTISSPITFADDRISKNNYTPLLIPIVYTLDNAWNKQSYDFMGSSDITPITEHTEPAYEDVPLNDALKLSANEAVEEDPDEPKSKLDNEMVDNIVKKIPFGKSLKSTWKVIKGDEDILSVEGLRIDRGNMGMRYKTDTLPFIGTVDGMKIKAEMGREQKLTFESDYLPMMGRVKGFNFKASAGEEAAVSFRYNTKFP